jgi:NAD(P)H dehydrogenase (quinone)
MTQTVLITGINGQQNTAIAKAYLASGAKVRGLSRAQASQLDEVQSFIGDPTSGQGMTQALENVDVVVFTSPLDYRDGIREALLDGLLTSAKAAGVKRIIFNPASSVLQSDHKVFKVLAHLKDRVLSSSLESVVIEPTVYMDNLLAPWSLPAIVNDGVFAYPIRPDIAVSWLSHKSLAEAMLAASTAPSGRVYRIGAQAVTGPQIAELLSKSVGRHVMFAPIPLDDFAAGLNASFGPPTGDDIAALYRHLDSHPHVMIRDDVDAKALGIKPESFADFIDRQDWKL